MKDFPVNINIRKYRSEDQQELIQIIRLNTPDYFAPEEEEDFIDYLNDEVELYFVLEIEGKIVGCGGVNFEKNQTNGIISWGMIHPEYQGKGIGTKLLQYRIDVLKNINTIKQISVRTSQLVYKFYEKNGFKLIESKKDFWAKGIDLYYMKLQ